MGVLDYLKDEEGKVYSSIQRWELNLGSKTTRNHEYIFVEWLKDLPRLYEVYPDLVSSEVVGLNPDELVEFQREHREYVILDAIQVYVQHKKRRDGKDASVGYKQRMYSTLTTFFLHNRVPLPQDVFRIKSDTPKVRGTLTFDEIRQVILASNVMYRSIFTIMYMGGLDQAGLVFWSDNGYKGLMAQLEVDDRYIVMDVSGRKKFKNRMPYYSMFAGDGLKALEIYLSSDRLYKLGKWKRHNPGASVETSPIFITRHGTRIDEGNLYLYWTRKMKELGFVKTPEGATSAMRYGKNLHEVRDVFRTRWHKSGSDPTAPEFMMGHVGEIDPNEYDKALNDVAFLRRQYRKALQWLNILTQDPEKIPLDEHERQMDRVEQLESQMEEMRPDVEDIAVLNLLMSDPETRALFKEFTQRIRERRLKLEKVDSSRGK